MTGPARSAARRARRRDERGAALPSPVVLLSILAIVMAGVAFVATGDGDPRPGPATTVAGESSSPSPSTSPSPTAKNGGAELTRVPAQRLEKKPPPVVRGEVIVEVYNNSNISGLAARTADQAAGAGWQVVGEDNWVGTITAPTVYYPERLQRAAELLARDLGIERVQPAVEPMRFDRLTVILTASYS